MDSNNINPTPVVNQITTEKKLPKIIAIVLLLALATIGVFLWYKNSNKQKQIEKKQQMIQDVAKSASEVKLTNEERSQAIKKIQSTKGIALPKDEAAKREQEIINALSQIQ